MFKKRGRSPSDFAREIQAHVEIEADRLIDEGMDPAAARIAARRRFGSALAAHERFYESSRFLWLDHLLQDLRHAARSLKIYPVSCAVAIISLAGGIGATTATLTIRDVVFRKPPALYRNPSELAKVQVGSPDHPIRGAGNPVPGPLYAIWRNTDLGGALAAAAAETVRQVRTTDRTDTVRVRAVSPEFFAVLGVDAALGRTFSPSSGRTGGPVSAGAGTRGQVSARDRGDLAPTAPVVLSHRVWNGLLDGRQDAIGATIWIGTAPYTVVGVMPERFWFSSMGSPVWTLLDPAATAAADSRVEVVVRRGPGETPAQLAERVQRGLSEYTRGLPAAERQQHLKVSGLEGTPLGNSVPLALPWLLSAAVLLTLLIACANVAILVIARWTAREHEIAIRASLGASRGRVVRALVTESVLIAVGGGVVGVCATFALRGLIVHNAGQATEFFDLSIDPRILIEAIVVTLLTGIAAGIGPALLETRRLYGNPMRTISSSDRVRQRWRHALVVLEIAVTVALLVVTGGMINTYQRNYTNDVGYHTHPLVLLRVENEHGVPVARVLDALTRMPGVAAAAPSTSVPFLAWGPMRRVSTEATGSRAVRVEQASIGPEFFVTLGVPLRAGRAFTSQDSSASRTAIVNELLAVRLFGGREPVGQTIWIGDTSYDVVGVVATYKNTALQNPDRDPKVFVPIATQTDAKQMTFLIRAATDPVAVERTIRRDIPATAAGNAVASAVTLDGIIDISGQEILVGTAPLVPLIATGMLLTAAGIYGVLAFAIARRSKELAVRIAIGASRRQVVRMVATHSLRLVIVGTLCGIGATFALSRVVRALGGSGSFLDPDWLAFAVPVAIVLGIGAVATWVPSRQALKIDPATLLRST